jgi:hypothetical protein
MNTWNMFESGADPRLQKESLYDKVVVRFPEIEKLHWFNYDQPAQCGIVNGMRGSLACAVTQLNKDGSIEIYTKNYDLDSEVIPVDVICYNIMKSLGMILFARDGHKMCYCRVKR